MSNGLNLVAMHVLEGGGRFSVLGGGFSKAANTRKSRCGTAKSADHKNLRRSKNIDFMKEHENLHSVSPNKSNVLGGSMRYINLSIVQFHACFWNL